MTKHKNKYSHGRHIWLLLLGLTGLALSVMMLLQGVDIALFNPKGFIARQQLNLMIVSVLLMLTVAVPTLILLYSFAWKYRESNQEAEYDPEARHGKLFIFSAWAVPSIFMLLLAIIMWPATQKLEPSRPIASDAKPITIQVVAMRWKWLFIYPEQNIATVNFVQVPAGTPIQFDLTADEAPISSFWIPHLGGQLYAMTGHVNRLNLLAEELGDYPGSTPEINGKGYARMKFTARASSREDFNRWVEEVRASPEVLDSTEYTKLLRPSEDNATALYSKADADLYARILMKYKGSQDSEPAESGGSE